MEVRASTVILVPVLARPHRVEPLLTAIWEATNEPHRVLFVATETDTDELAAINAAGADALIGPWVTYPEKINAGYRETTEPWMFLAADDIAPHVGWLSEAQAVGYANRALVVGTNDLGNPRVLAGEHSTHTLVDRRYCDHPGATATQRGSVLHEGYQHWYCDDELVGVAKKRGVFASASDSVVEHLHPFFGKAEHDATYRKGEQRKRADLREHQRRRRRWK